MEVLDENSHDAAHLTLASDGPDIVDKIINMKGRASLALRKPSIKLSERNKNVSLVIAGCRLITITAGQLLLN